MQVNVAVDERNQVLHAAEALAMSSTSPIGRKTFTADSNVTKRTSTKDIQC